MSDHTPNGPVRIGSCFAGVGGFDLAGEAVGAQTAWTSEIEKSVKAVLEQKFPDATHYGSITEVDGADAPAIDILTGGSPCQGFSIAGLGGGLSDPRSGLFGEFMRVAAETDAKWVVWENVPGAFSTNDGKDFENVIGALVGSDRPVELAGAGRAAGWASHGTRTVVWRVLDARHFGVPQRRRRIIAVAGPTDERPWEVLFEREGGSGDPRAVAEARSGTATDAQAGAGGAGGTRGAGPDAGGTDRGGRRGDRSVGPAGGDRLTEAVQVDGSEVASTLRGFGHGWQGQHNDTNAVVVPDGDAKAVSFNQRDEARVGGDTAYALQAQPGVDEQLVAVPYTVHGEHSTAMQGEGDAHVAFETDRARCLDTTGGYATNQGGTVVAEPLGFDSRQVTSPSDRTRVEPGGPMPCLNTHAGEMGVVEQVVQGDAIPIQNTATREGTAKTPSKDAAGFVRLRDPGMGIGAEGDPQFTLDCSAPHAVAVPADGHDGRHQVPFRKSRRAADSEDAESWVEADVSNTQNLFDHGDVRAVEVVVEADGTEAVPQEAPLYNVRRLTPVETERLQGFPDGWTEACGSDSARYRATGNAVAVPVVAWVLGRIVARERGVQEWDDLPKMANTLEALPWVARFVS